MANRTAAVVVLSLFWAYGTAGAGTKPAVSFREQVAPVLVKSCLGCHNDKKAESGLDMSTFARFKKGGKSAGASILEPGDPDSSELILSVRPDAEPRMPYKLPPLDSAAIQTLEAWVEQGARFDGPSEASTPLVSLVDPLRGLPKIAARVAVADPVTSLAFSPDGTTLAAAAGNRVVVFDVLKGMKRATFEGHPGPLNVVRFAPDGKTLLAAGGRPGLFGSVTVWDLATNRRVAEARSHADTVVAAEISPDGTTLATGGYDRLVILWDLASLKPRQTLKDHTDSVNALAFSPDGRTLASAASDRTVKLWTVATGRRGATLSDATAELYAVAFAPDGSTLLAAGVDRSIRSWRVSARDVPLERTAFAHDGPVLRLAASPDGKTLASGGEDRVVKIWNLATLEPRKALTDQSDWPQALALGQGARGLAVGRHDGSVDLYDPATGGHVLSLQTAIKPVAAGSAKPELFRNASLNPPSPRGGARGTTVRVTLTGTGVGRAVELTFAGPGLAARILPAATPDPNRLDVEIAVAADARPGLHRIGVVTPSGVPADQMFSVEEAAGVTEAGPDDDPAALKPVALPSTLLGTIETPGDVDHFRFAVKKGQPLRFETTAKALGSALSAVLTLLDGRGRVVAEADAPGDGRDPVLTAVAPEDGFVSLRVADVDYGGSGNHFYRIAASSRVVPTGVFPLGVPTGVTTALKLDGETTVTRTAPAGSAGTLLEVSGPPAPSALPLRVVAADGPQGIEAEPNDTPGGANPLETPGGVSGSIGRAGDVDHYRFKARRGERRVVETFGRRLGTPVDSVIEILDESGKPVPRALLRPVSQTEVAFRDHNSTVPGIRLTAWKNLEVNDVVLIGREVTKVFALPRNPDDDCLFWSENGRRVGLLDTTPEHHPMGQAVTKVEVHPPGAALPAGGSPPVALSYRNDDGGAESGKDSRLIFDAPADGTYVVRVGDVRGLGGADFGYHLVVRHPRPGFRLGVSPENPAVPRGATSLVTVNLTRLDGFDGPVEVVAENLPAGVTATPARVERGMTTGLLALTADATAPGFSPPTWTLRARKADTNGPTAPDPGTVSTDPGGPKAGRILVTGDSNLRIRANPARLVLRPGREATMTLSVERGAAFAGRVPIEVRNLPQGVKVLNIGLNGVLVTEGQTSRVVTLYAEPWAAAVERPVYAVGRAESAGTEVSSAPILLTVEPGGERR